MDILEKGDLVIYRESDFRLDLPQYYIAEVKRVTKTLAVCEIQNGSNRELKLKRKMLQNRYEAYPISTWMCAFPYIGKYIDLYNIQNSIKKSRSKSKKLLNLIYSKDFVGINRDIMDEVSEKLVEITTMVSKEINAKKVHNNEPK